MGIQGTDVAEENSDIIILKDNFASLWRLAIFMKFACWKFVSISDPTVEQDWYQTFVIPYL
uniref:Uncharacterized protein n=1 Tax=Manihot esculenta TaxID=3983 RepID=A0A251K1R6_MANES